jgi:hypothetical protein
VLALSQMFYHSRGRLSMYSCEFNVASAYCVRRFLQSVAVYCRITILRLTLFLYSQSLLKVASVYIRQSTAASVHRIHLCLKIYSYHRIRNKISAHRHLPVQGKKFSCNSASCRTEQFRNSIAVPLLTSVSIVVEYSTGVNLP